MVSFPKTYFSKNNYSNNKINHSVFTYKHSNICLESNITEHESPCWGGRFTVKGYRLAEKWLENGCAWRNVPKI